MPIKIPGRKQLKGFGPQAFSSESALQEFIEDKVLPLCGLRLVTTSKRGPRLGGIDTFAIDAAGAPVILEYKRGDANQKAREQLARYKKWLLAHKERVGKAVAAKLKVEDIKWERLSLVLLGYRHRPKKRPAPSSNSEIQLLRYGYDQEGRVFISKVVPANVRTFGDERVPAFSKAKSIRKHQAKTTVAGRRAFRRLSKQLQKRGLEERFPGKNRVWYVGGGQLRAEVTFTRVGLEVSFKAGARRDTEGRVAPSGKKKLNRTVGVLSRADVPYVVRLICR